jgi:thioredoxin 1
MKEILYFTGVWCTPCKQLGPIMDSLQGQINFRKIDVDNDTELSVKYGVRNIPTLILLKDGEAVNRMTGLQPKQQIIDFYNG